MSQVTVHAITGSPFARAVLATLIEKGAPYRHAPMVPGQHKSPEYLARHPFGRVPIIEHDGFELYETQAILRYLDRVFPDPALTPADPRAAARMDQAMNVTDWYFFRVVGVGIVFNRVVAPRLGFPSNEEAVTAALPESRVILKAIEGLLGDKPYMAGDKLTLADLHLGPQIDMLAQCSEGREMLDGSPLEAWLARLNARPSFSATTWDQLAAAA
ncbi:MAG: glutathione S-transferase family protein [Caulobacterales bacterium]